MGFTPSPVGRPAKGDGASRKQERRRELGREKAVYSALRKADLLTEEMQDSLIEGMRLPYIRKQCANLPLSSNRDTGAITKLAELHENTRLACKNVNFSRKQKKELRQDLTRNSTPATAKLITGLSRWSNWRMSRPLPQVLKACDAYDMANECPVVETHGEETVVWAVEIMYCGFFEKYSGVYSGSDNELRKMEMPKCTMHCMPNFLVCTGN
jgi:hypothetical protein